MLIFIHFLFFSTSISFPVADVNIDYIRNNYEQAAKDEQLCKKLLHSTEVKANSTLFKGYYGAFQAIYASHITNSSEKLKHFKTGKSHIEQAISSEPKNVELRFVRLSVQKMAPSFLGYNKKIEEDKKFIQENLTSIKSSKLLTMCKQLIK